MPGRRNGALHRRPADGGTGLRWLPDGRPVKVVRLPDGRLAEMRPARVGWALMPTPVAVVFALAGGGLVSLGAQILLYAVGVPEPWRPAVWLSWPVAASGLFGLWWWWPLRQRLTRDPAGPRRPGGGALRRAAPATRRSRWIRFWSRVPAWYAPLPAGLLAGTTIAGLMVLIGLLGMAIDLPSSAVRIGGWSAASAWLIVAGWWLWWPRRRRIAARRRALRRAFRAQARARARRTATGTG